jgi:beta-1,4-mannosyl-glycoprotein beta-1,4-N-acetylglucosaminyltransferase
MIYDCFTFFNEFDLLEIRLHEMDPWVDRFVLVESAETFSGLPKPLWFKDKKNLFEPFLPKITHLISPLVSKSMNAWERQDSQRNYAMEALTDCSAGDLIIIGDVDEIVRGKDFTKIQNHREKMTTFIQHNYFYYMNLQRPGGWPGSVMMPYSTLKSEYGGSLWEARRLRRRGGKVRQGGWHFSNMGGAGAIRTKLKASCHFDTTSYKKMYEDTGYLYDLMEGERTIKGRKLTVVPIGDNYPVWFKTNVEKFKHLLTKEN